MAFYIEIDDELVAFNPNEHGDGQTQKDLDEARKFVAEAMQMPSGKEATLHLVRTIIRPQFASQSFLRTALKKLMDISSSNTLQLGSTKVCAIFVH